MRHMFVLAQFCLLTVLSFDAMQILSETMNFFWNYKPKTDRNDGCQGYLDTRAPFAKTIDLQRSKEYTLSTFTSASLTDPMTGSHGRIATMSIQYRLMCL